MKPKQIKQIKKNLEQIKQAKIKEAEDVFLKVGLDPKKELTRELYINPCMPIQPSQSEEQGTKTKLIWTRLSHNTNPCLVIE